MRLDAASIGARIDWDRARLGSPRPAGVGTQLLATPRQWRNCRSRSGRSAPATDC